MADDFSSKLETLAREIGRVKFSLDGSNLTEFTFEVSHENHILLFSHANILVKASDFELIDAEEWAKTEDWRYPALSGKFGIRYFYYRANVHWKVASAEGKGRIALGYWQHRDELLSALENTRERDIIDNLLATLDKTAARLYDTGLLGPVKAEDEERSYLEDQPRGRWAKVF